MSVYSDKLAHVHVIINCRYSIAQMCTCKDRLARYLGMPSIDDIIKHNMLITPVFKSSSNTGEVESWVSFI